MKARGPFGDHFRDEGLGVALDLAISKDRAPLYDKLRRACGLPGPRLNAGLVSAFASEVARRGAIADRLIAAMLSINEDIAPYGHVDEILPILGVAAAAARANADPKARKDLLEMLEEASCDSRSRVRDEVASALILVGNTVGPKFAGELRRWIAHEQPYLGRAALTALLDVELLATLGPEHSAELLDTMLVRIKDAHRAEKRHDGFRKFLRAAMLVAPAMIARHPTAIEVVVKHAASQDVDVRSVLEASVDPIRHSRNSERADVIEAALAKSKKPSRDPRWDRLPGKRGRGKR